MFRSKYTKPRNNTITNDVSNTNLGSNNSQPTIQTSPMASLTNMVPAVAKNEIPTTLSEIIPSSNINTKNLSEKTDKRGFPIPKFSKPLNSMKDSSNFKVDERGFPIPGSFVEKSLSGTKRPKLTIIQGMNKATEDITNAAIHFAVTTGAVGLNKVLDAMAFTLFQLDNLTMNNKEEVLKQLEEKMKLFQYLAHDEKSKEIIRKLGGALGLIIMEGSITAKEPLLRAFINLSNTTTDGINNIIQNGGKFIKNAIKIIPGIGDAYIILDNVLSVAISGSRAAAIGAKNNEEIARTSEDILKRLKMNFEPPLKEYEQSLNELGEIQKNLDNVNISDVLQKTTDKLQNVESSIANNIKDTGTITANAITNAAPTLSNTRKRRFFGGKKKLKSSLKQDRKKKRKKSVRFDI